MKIAALSSATGVSVATLKFYLREGLLPAGESTAVNQADYGEAHVRRVRLVRALIDLGHLSLADVSRVLAAVDNDDMSLHDAFGVAQDAMVPQRLREGDDYVLMLDEVTKFVARHRLDVRPEAEVRKLLADALLVLRDFGWVGRDGRVDSGLLDWLAEPIIDNAIERRCRLCPSRPIEPYRSSSAWSGTVAFEVAAAAIRRLALEHASYQRFAPTRQAMTAAGRIGGLPPFAPFALEQWQSEHEQNVDINIADSGVRPLTIRELLELAGDPSGFLDVELHYPEVNGSRHLRTLIAGLYDGVSADQVLVTVGGAEANAIARRDVGASGRRGGGDVAVVRAGRGTGPGTGAPWCARSPSTPIEPGRSISRRSPRP